MTFQKDQEVFLVTDFRGAIGARFVEYTNDGNAKVLDLDQKVFIEVARDAIFSTKEEAQQELEHQESERNGKYLQALRERVPTITGAQGRYRQVMPS
jgi:hypothetical protein